MNQNEAVGMSYQEKNNIVSLITTLAVSVPYMVYIFQQFQNNHFSTADEFHFWVKALLFLIPIRIVSEIIIHIIMSILTAIVTQKEEEDSLTDERDEIIELKTTRNSTVAFIIGFMVSLVVVYFVKTPSSMFIVMFISGFLSELVGIFSQIYYYRKG